MSPRKRIKNRMEWKTRPLGVGHPLTDVITKDPKTCCVSLYVSGFAMRKKTRAL